MTYSGMFKLGERRFLLTNDLERYLLKEARYGVYDLENDGHYATPEDREWFRAWAVQRLLRYVKFKMGVIPARDPANPI